MLIECDLVFRQSLNNLDLKLKSQLSMKLIDQLGGNWLENDSKVDGEYWRLRLSEVKLYQ